MPVVSANLLLIPDLAFFVTVLGLSDGTELPGPFPAHLSGHPTPKGDRVTYSMWASIFDERGALYNLKRRFENRAVTFVAYTMYHFPSHSKSPSYEHQFKFEVAEVGGIPQPIGAMKLYPGEQVWPELTSKGWCGNLPQFYK